MPSAGDGCAGAPCGANGECKARSNGNYSCECDRGFEFRNATCLVKASNGTASPCAGNPCGPNGECKVEDGTFECKVS